VKQRDRALVGILSFALIALSIVALAPSMHSAEGSVEPTPNIPDARHYVEGVVGRATNASPFGARSAADRALVSLLFRGLVRLGPGSSIVSDLAARWQVDPSGRAWTFHLRDGLFWQDGEPITADDVAFTVGVLSNPSYTGPGGESWRDVQATVIDRQTVELDLTTPLGGFLQAATLPIAPAHLLAGVPIEELATDQFGAQPVGSGPFRLLSLDDTRAMLAAATPVEPLPADPGLPYFASQRPPDSLANERPTPRTDIAIPYLARMELRYYDDAEALQADWDAGVLDAASGLQPSTAVELAATAGARLVSYPGTTLLAATLNLRTGRTEYQDPSVRRALLESIDRDRLVSSILDRLGTRADSLIPASSPMFDAEMSKAVAFDPTAAGKLLVAAGWKRSAGSWTPKGWPQQIVIELISPEESANPVAYAVAAAVVDAWHGIGLAVRHVPLPAAELINDRLGKGEFQVAVVPLAIGLDPDLYPLLAASQTRAGGSNVIGLQDPDLDKLLVAARTPVDETGRIAAYRALQARLAASTYVLPLAFRNEYVVFRNTVSGPSGRPLGTSGDRYWDVLTWRLADGS
jgi:peptide/nickel transport system substrate-binding protein